MNGNKPPSPYFQDLDDLSEYDKYRDKMPALPGEWTDHGT